MLALLALLHHSGTQLYRACAPWIGVPHSYRSRLSVLLLLFVAECQPDVSLRCDTHLLAIQAHTAISLAKISYIYPDAPITCHFAVWWLRRAVLQAIVQSLRSHK